MSFDPRTISTPVYEALNRLRSQTEAKYKDNEDKKKAILKEQKRQAVEIYTYLSTWGLMRLKAEEQALSQEGKKDVVRKYFDCLQEVSKLAGEDINITGSNGLTAIKDLNCDRYLGLTGLALELAQEFSFWANAIYHDVKSDSN